jgi:hypothetical protein
MMAPPYPAFFTLFAPFSIIPDDKPGDRQAGADHTGEEGQYFRWQL